MSLLAELPAAARIFTITPGGLKLGVRLTPKSSRDALGGLIVMADGRALLKARVRAVPEKGRANEALIRLIAKALEIPRTYVTLVSGNTSRIKTLLIDGDQAGIRQRLESLIAQGSQESSQ